MALEEKKSFVLYSDLFNLVSQLPDETAGKLFKIILQYVNNIEVCVEDLLLKIAFEPIRTQLERDFEKWDKIKVRRSEAGKQGGRPKKIENEIETVEETEKAKKANALFEKQSKAKKAVNVNDTVTVNVNDTVTVINKEREKKNFSPPSLLEVQDYISEKKYGVNAHSFWNFYESKNWMVGKNKMKDWTKAISGWESRNNDKSNQNQNGKQIANPPKQAYEFSVDRIIETYSSNS